MKWVLITVVLAVGATACHKSCPRGARLQGSPPPLGNAQWCERSEPVAQNLPVPGRTYESTLGIRRPMARGRLLDGASTEWYASGQVKSHGRFALTPAKRSEPHGVWTFWYESGQRESQVRYHMGRPVGCAAYWERDGRVQTYAPSGDTFRTSRCGLVVDRAATKLAARHHGGARSGPDVVKFAVALGALLSPSRLAIDADGLTHPDESIRENLRVEVRRRVGPVGLGLAGGARATSSGDSWSAHLGGIGSLAIPSSIDWLDLELSVEAGGRVYSSMPRLGRVTAPRERFAVPYAGGQAGVGLHLSGNVRIYASFQLERDLTRSVDRDYRFCGSECATCPVECLMAPATWRIGGTTYGALISLRFLVR